LYTQNADGEWSYSLPNIEAFCPEGTVFPEVPGEQPKRPQETDYMTEEELAAYQEAYDEWVASWYQGEYPEYTSFMSDEEIAAFNAAYEEYQALYEAWAEKNEAFEDVYYEVLATAPSYEFNNVYLTPSGSKYLTTSATEVETDDPNSWFPWVTVYAPTVIDLTTGVATDIETGGVDMMVFDVPNEDVIMLTNGLSADIPAGWIYKDGVATSLVDYFKSFGEEASAWVDENLFYEIPLGYDFDNPILDEEGNIVDYPVLSTETYVSGLCCATPDLKWMAMWIYNSFDWESDYMTFSWIINADEMSGVKDVINVGNGNVTFDAAGNLVATGDINAVSVYDLQGRRVLDTTATGTVANQLPAGVYVVRATGDNTTITAKLRK
ncbi:MAG: T9SS type A sorting domain-containing protein, partial [Muribaculaceae bacterium]